jgi:Asp-tRNA(Asn)/Glu-tRNA(Gln) amidotransferase A subunit family amidase
MAGEDKLDPKTLGSSAKAEPGPYTHYLKADALKGKRFGVPAFILDGRTPPFQGIPSGVSDSQAAAIMAQNVTVLRPETRAAFMRAIEGLRAAGATVVFDPSILPDSFADVAARVGTTPYVKEGTEQYLAEFGPAQYHSSAEYLKAVGSPLPVTIIGGTVGEDMNRDAGTDRRRIVQTLVESDAAAQAGLFEPRRKALEAYNETLDRLHLDGYVYPATQISGGPHSDTSWVNILGVPAVVVPGGFYPDGLPFGLEISARPWKDGDLLGWAFAYEQQTKLRRPPVLVEQGLLPDAR